MATPTTTLTEQIATATKELVIRESAARHLRGIPARQNAASISALYDRLNHLHIERIEAGLPFVGAV